MRCVEGEGFFDFGVGGEEDVGEGDEEGEEVGARVERLAASLERLAPERCWHGPGKEVEGKVVISCVSKKQAGRSKDAAEQRFGRWPKTPMHR